MVRINETTNITTVIKWIRQEGNVSILNGTRNIIIIIEMFKESMDKLIN